MYKVIPNIILFLKRILPHSMVRPLLPFYHAVWSFSSAVFYGFPGQHLIVIGVTGTKGKSTVVEMLAAIYKQAGEKVAIASTIRFSIDEDSKPNLFKMTTPGHGFIQAFLKRAQKARCTYAIIEITSESVLQYRHWFLFLNGLIVTNIHPEHIERHGSFEKYIAAKRKIVGALEHSHKKKRILVVGNDSVKMKSFLTSSVPHTITFQRNELQKLIVNDSSVSFLYKDIHITLNLSGAFNALNALAAIKMCSTFGISLTDSSYALSHLLYIPGRVEHISLGQKFIVVVDYAHTPESLQALYEAFPHRRKICVLGNTGGGRDKWKRPEMGRIADEACAEVILTNEDPYDENPVLILNEMARGMKRQPHIIMDRRSAIYKAITLARPGDAVLISGKGTDPYIMGPNGTVIEWSDATVAREELHHLKQETSGEFFDIMVNDI